MTFLRKWIPRLYMLITFIWAIGYLIWKYSETVVLEETTTSLPIPILIVIVLLITVLTIGGSIILLFTWWEEIKKDKLSFYTLAPISILMLGVIILSKLGIHKVYVLIEASVERFLIDLTTYNGSLTVLIWILASGFIVGLIGFIWEWVEKLQTP